MQRVENYLLAPGTCFLCGGDHRPAVDTEVTTEGLHLTGDDGNDEHWLHMEGRVYVCAICTRQLVGLLGDELDMETVKRGTLAAANDRITELEARLEGAAVEVREAKALVAATIRNGYVEVNPEVFDVLDDEERAVVMAKMSADMARPGASK